MKNKLKNILFATLLCFSLTACSSPATNEVINIGNDTISKEQEIESTQARIENNNENQSSVSTNEDLHIYILDVGQGSACLIQNGNHNMLIDAGENTCEELIVQYLNDLNVSHLEYVIGTHPDSDHVGGLDAVIDNFDIDTVFLSAITDKDTKTCKDVLASLDAKQLTYSTPAVGETYSLGDATFLILAPSKHYEDANDNSIALKLTYGEFDFVTTGDCERYAEKDICELDYDLNAEVYNAGHHGSSNASSEELIDRIKPTAVTISCGADNKYKHPHDKTLKRFNDRDISVYRTDELGTIEITSDGNTFNINGITIETSVNSNLPTVNDNNVKEENILSEEIIEEDTNMEEFSETIVWITKTGTKYHREDCDSLSNSKIECDLDTAILNGLEPCKKCNPPIFGE